LAFASTFYVPHPFLQIFLEAVGVAGPEVEIVAAGVSEPGAVSEVEL
jgi:hypothetical protein